jgi:hypothetical protein
MAILIPRMQFSGSDSARQMSRIFAENVCDLRSKVDRGGDARYGDGFFHTSTVPHEGTCYYDHMWSRDAGRGLIELCRLGFAEDALRVTRFFLDHVSYEDHWGRMIAKGGAREELLMDFMRCETDGNAMALLGIYNTWRINGRTTALAKELLQGAWQVVLWVKREMDASPYGDLMPCVSELSGNPNSDYLVYAIYPNYGMKTALSGLAGMARAAGLTREAEVLESLHARLSQSLLDRLVSGRNAFSDGSGLAVFEDLSPVPEGCWINGIDGRNGKEYLFSEWAGTSWPVYHWTRQVPFVFDSDLGELGLVDDRFRKVQTDSYAYLHAKMCEGRFFRKYGFVSNTAWSGMGGRHDDTMCGYGQGLMTQASLVMDDVNTYTKLVEGMARLAYDGDVVQPLSFEMNPWVFHECFSYENYEEGKDHTFGALCEGRYGIMDNPGDEGNLVQEAEALKCLTLMAGIDDSRPGTLRILPRLPWDWDRIHVKDMPFVDGEGNLGRIEYTLEHERWLRRASIRIHSSIPVSDCEVRIGPFPAHNSFVGDSQAQLEHTKGGTWIRVTGLSGTDMEYEVSLDG